MSQCSQAREHLRSFHVPVVLLPRQLLGEVWRAALPGRALFSEVCQGSVQTHHGVGHRSRRWRDAALGSYRYFRFALFSVVVGGRWTYVLFPKQSTSHENAAAMNIFDIQDDFDLCDRVFGRFAEFCNEIDVDSYTELERVLTLVWHSSGLIGNGGFHYLLEGDFNGDPGFVYTAASYQRIGALRAYEAIQDAIKQFPGGVLPADIDERMRAYEAVPKETWDQIEGRYYDAAKDTERCLARFIRDHRSQYEDLLKQKAL